MTPSNLTSPVNGEIVSGSVYQLPEFMRRTGMGRKAVAAARRRGLPVHRHGRRSYVVSDEAIEFFRGTKTVG